ncbi:hypothetical protein Tco_1286375, partial [Tanacetum coccineum]
MLTASCSRRVAHGELFTASCSRRVAHGELLTKLQKNPIFHILVDIHQNTNFVRAFTTSANVPSIYIQLFWNTLTHDAKTGIGKKNLLLDLQKLQKNPIFCISVDIRQNTNYVRAFTTSANLTRSDELLRKTLNVTPTDSAYPFESPPAGKTDITLNWLMKMKFNRLMNLIWMIMSTIYNKRWIIASPDETTGPSVHPEDATSTKMVRETLSHADHLRRWTKDHPLDNIVGNPSRP